MMYLLTCLNNFRICFKPMQDLASRSVDFPLSPTSTQRWWSIAISSAESSFQRPAASWYRDMCLPSSLDVARLMYSVEISGNLVIIFIYY